MYLRVCDILIFTAKSSNMSVSPTEDDIKQELMLYIASKLYIYLVIHADFTLLFWLVVPSFSFAIRVLDCRYP